MSEERFDRIEKLNRGGLRIIQNPRLPRFSLDSLLLADFACLPDGLGSICDLGSGSGVIPLLLSVRYPHSGIIGVELMPQMVRLSRKSVALNGLGGRIEIIEADLKTCTLPSSVNLVLANPPYYPPDSHRVSGDPNTAAARFELHCSLADVVAAACRLLGGCGELALCLPSSRLLQAQSLLDKHGFTLYKCRKVRSMAAKEPYLLLLQASLQPKPPQPLADLVVFNADGSYTDELKTILTLEEDS